MWYYYHALHLIAHNNRDWHVAHNTTVDMTSVTNSKTEGHHYISLFTQEDFLIYFKEF
jgi:hypothetical protein